MKGKVTKGRENIVLAVWCTMKRSRGGSGVLYCIFNSSLVAEQKEKQAESAHFVVRLR